MPGFPFQDPHLSEEERVKDLLGRLTLAEKVSLMVYDSPAIERLGIQAYNWWNEALHGVGRAGIATVFPQAIGLGATFDTSLLHRVAAAIADEARAKHHEFARQGYRRQYHGLTYWSPNVNIFRDPRWGRGQETYGEDPFLTGRIGAAFVRGLQGDDPRHPKLVATPKHFAVHSGPEALRHHFDARVSERDLRETYLPAFRDCVIEAGALSVMGAYNRTNGEPCCGSPTLLGQILRREWGFTGYVVSDCGAIADFHAHHTFTRTPRQSAALAVRSGCDLECGNVYPALVDAVAEGLITEAEIDTALGRLLVARMRLGVLTADSDSPHARIAYDRVDCDEHRALAREAARASIVLLKNDRGILPLRRELGCIAVIGPNADDREVLLGNYSGRPSRSTTVLDGIRATAGPRAKVLYAPGCSIDAKDVLGWAQHADDGFGEALAAAGAADVVVLVLGINNRLEGEEGSASASQWMGDRINIELPGIQRRLFRAVAGKGKPIVLVLLTGSPLALPEEHDAAQAVVLGWYPGEEGGAAVADVLFGMHNPSARLPITFVRSADQLPPFTDYAMTGRTYRYLTSEPLYPFGFGLSYSRFRYAKLSLSATSAAAGATITVTVEIANESAVDGHEVAQLYVAPPAGTGPVRQLAGFERVWIPARAAKKVSFTLAPRHLSTVSEEGVRSVRPGRYLVSVGGRQPDARSAALGGSPVAEASLELTGSAHTLPA
jgi:beta-glucosidase